MAEPHRRGRERGAVSVLVALLAATGVLLGIGAIVVDVGQLYAEREELQSGADAAALAVAGACATTPQSCADAASAVAQHYADTNAKDGAATLTAVCGRANGLLACPTPNGGLTACLGNPPPAAGYVEVRLATRRDDGDSRLRPTFTGVGARVAACARVTWAAPASVDVYALTISTCEWNAATANGTNLKQPPPAVPPASAETVLYVHGNAPTCPAGPSGWNAPGGFGWLDHTGGCTLNVAAPGSYAGDTGTSVSWPCFNAMAGYRNARKVVLIPIYDGVQGNGQQTVYHIVGFAAFVITGYNITGTWANSWLTGRAWCSGNTKCLYGYFTGKYLQGTPGSGGVDYGVAALTLVG